MGSMNRLSILLSLLLCLNLSSARKFSYEHHAHHSALHPYQGASHSVTSEPDPEQPDEAAHYGQIASEPDPEQSDGDRSEWATMWSSGRVIPEEPPKGGSDPQDIDSVVLVAEPYHPPQKRFHPHGFGLVAHSIEPDPFDPGQPEFPPKGMEPKHDRFH